MGIISAQAASPRRHTNQQLAIGQSGSRSVVRDLLRSWLVVFLVVGVTLGQETKPQKPSPTKPQQEEEAPPEEDESLKPKVFSFNPLEAERDVRIGNYYFKRHNYPAALSRFQEATKWNPNMADAYFHVGETAEKMKDKSGAKQAYQKYLELAPDGKEAERLKKKVGGT